MCRLKYKNVRSTLFSVILKKTYGSGVNINLELGCFYYLVRVFRVPAWSQTQSLLFNLSSTLLAGNCPTGGKLALTPHFSVPASDTQPGTTPSRATYPRYVQVFTASDLNGLCISGSWKSGVFGSKKQSFATPDCTYTAWRRFM